jgi:hypothetical protein
MSQMWPSKVKGGGGWVQMVEKKNHIAHFQDYYQTPKQVFESRSVSFMVERWFVVHKVALL